MSRTCPDCSSQYDDEVVRCPEDGRALLSTPGDPLLGRLVGSYRVERLLGKGGMGAVYLAEHPVIHSRVAVKFLHPRYARDGGIVERFFNEARAVNLIGHDNIVKILDLDVTGEGRHYFVMEYLQGRSLHHLVASGNPIPLAVAGPILLQCCEALQAAHERGIVHRDLKPENVHLSVHKGRQNFVKVLDFGIAKLLDGTGQSTGQTRTGMVVGTPGYMSPEQASGRTSDVDGRSDVFSLGVMMFQMATGRLPFPGHGFPGEEEENEARWEPPSPRGLAPAIPEEYEKIVLRCLAEEQDARFASMRELHDAIEGCLIRSGLPTGLPRAEPSDVAVRPAVSLRRTARTDPSSTTPGRPPRRRDVPPVRKSSRPGLIAVALAGLALSLVAAGYLAGGAGAGRAATAPADVVPRAAPETVFLAVVSDPHGAIAEATWSDGKKAGITPFEVEVPKSATVRVEFSKAGFSPYVSELVADASQLVEGKLAEPPKPVPPPRPQATRASRKKEPPKPEPPPDPAESKLLVDPGDQAMDIVW